MIEAKAFLLVIPAQAGIQERNRAILAHDYDEGIFKRMMNADGLTATM